MYGVLRRAVLAAAMMCTVAGTALAQPAAYPDTSKPIHLLVGFSPGGGTDLAARLLAERLGKELGTTVVVENYTSGGGLEAVNRLVAAKPDGYTIALVPLPATVMLYVDPQRGGKFTADDIVPIAVHDFSHLAIATAADGKWQSMQQLLAAAKEKPNSVTAASSGVLALGHLGILLLNEAAGVQINWTTFEQAGQMRSALLGHHIDIESSGIGEVASAVRSGDVRVLTVFSDERLPDFPDVPTARELGINITPRSTRAVIAPKGTPPEVVEKLSAAIGAISKDPDYQKAAAERQVSLYYLDSDDAKAFWMKNETDYRPLVAKFRAAQSK